MSLKGFASKAISHMVAADFPNPLNVFGGGATSLPVTFLGFVPALLVLGRGHIQTVIAVAFVSIVLMSGNQSCANGGTCQSRSGIAAAVNGFAEFVADCTTNHATNKDCFRSNLPLSVAIAVAIVGVVLVAMAMVTVAVIAVAGVVIMAIIVLSVILLPVSRGDMAGTLWCAFCDGAILRLDMHHSGVVGKHVAVILMSITGHGTR